MNNLEQFASHLAKTWGAKTLEELRVEAEREDSGISFESIRANGEQRLVVVLCATDLDKIAKLEKVFDLVDSGADENWNILTLADATVRTVRRGGLSFEALRDEFGRRSAVVLIAAEPTSMRVIETVFDLPK
jgi:hypothetical protein